MKITWKVVYAFLCVLTLLLMPFVYADEKVEVEVYKDGEIAGSMEPGDILTLHAELVSAGSMDSIRFELQDNSLEFVDNIGSDSITVYGRYNGTLWTYETKVKVLDNNPTIPKGIVVRDSRLPDLSDTESPKSLTINLNTDQIVAPGNQVTAEAVLDPAETVNPKYYDYVEWAVTYDGIEVPIDVKRGEKIHFTVPEEAVGKVIGVYSTLKGYECNLGQEIFAKTKELRVKDESLSVRIFPSVDSEGIVKGKYIGFSSEILRNGKVAEKEVSDKATYTWTSQIGDQFVNGQRQDRTTYAVSPDQLGTLTVFLEVTLENGIILKSDPIVKTVVDEDRNLESITLSVVETGQAVVGKQIEVRKALEPEYVTDLNNASYYWKAVQDEEVIAESNEEANLIFTPKKAGSVSVTLSITPDGKEPIESEPLIINIPAESHNPESTNNQAGLTVDSPGTSGNSSLKQTEEIPVEPEEKQESKPEELNSKEILKLKSGQITTENNKENLYTGDNITVNASFETEGTLGEIEGFWKATNEDGSLITSSNQLDNFSFTPDKEGKVTVSLTAYVTDQTNSIEEDPIRLQEVYQIKPVTEQSGGELISQEDETQNKETDLVGASTQEKLEESKPTETSNVQSSETGSIDAVGSVPNSLNQSVSSSNRSYSQNSGNKGTGVFTSSYTNTPVSKSSTPTSYSQSGTVFTRTSNIENPKTGVDFTVGQIAVITVCSVLIISAVTILIRKTVSHN